MKNIDSIKASGQASVARLVNLGKQQPAGVQTFAFIGGSALVGGMATTALAKGLLSFVGAGQATSCANGGAPTAARAANAADLGRSTASKPAAPLVIRRLRRFKSFRYDGHGLTVSTNVPSVNP